MTNQVMDMRLRQVENQMMPFMCLNTAITTQMMVQSQNSCNHMGNLPNPDDHPIGLDAVENSLVGDIDDYSVVEFLFVGSFDVVGCSTFVVDCLSDDRLG
jgi:hypothetical protein